MNGRIRLTRLLGALAAITLGVSACPSTPGLTTTRGTAAGTGTTGSGGTTSASSTTGSGATTSTGTTTSGGAGGADGGAGAPPSFASIGPVWTDSRAGRIDAIAFHPTDANTLLIASSVAGGGVFRTTNGGTSWTPAMTGLVAADGHLAGTVDALWINPTSSLTALAGTQWDGTFQSQDGGQTWAPVAVPASIAGAGVYHFVYAGGTLFAASSVGVLEWNGTTWTLAQSTTSAVNALTALGTTVLAGSDAGDVYQHMTGTTTWTSLGKAPAAVKRLAIDPVSPMIVYAGVTGGAGSYGLDLYVSNHGGAPPWAAFPYNGGSCAGVNCGAQDIGFSTVPHLDSSQHPIGRLYVASDGQTHWADVSGGTNPTYSLGAVQGHDTRALYLFPNAAGTDDRCFVGSDQGVSVAETCSVAMSTVAETSPGLSIGLINDFAVASDGMTLVAVVQDYNTATSADGGAHWTLSTMGGEAGFAAFNASLPGQCYDFHKAFYASTNNCVALAQTSTIGSIGGGHGPTANNYAFDPSAPSTFYVVAATPTPSIQRTTDGGMTFTATSWPFTNPTLVTIAPGNAKHILVADGSKLSVSCDATSCNGGTSWKAATGLPASGTITVAVSPEDENRVLAAVRDATTNEVTAYRSTTGGRSFVLGGTVVPASASYNQGNFGGVVYSPSTTAPHAVITSNNGAYLSADDGAHWQRLDTQLTTRRFTAAHFAKGYLYLASYGQGILRSTTPIE